jgi:hypothetical protein
MATNRIRAAIVALACAGFGTALMASAALAQSSGSPGAMPLPPSASDPPPKELRPGGTHRNARSDRAKKNAAPAAAGTSASDYRGRLEGSDMELEDDPRVRPTMENGRPGLGMRF